MGVDFGAFARNRYICKRNLKNEIMKKIAIALSFILGMGLSGYAETDYHVIPLPRSIQEPAKAGSYALAPKSIVTYKSGNEKMANNARLLQQYLAQDAGFAVVPQADVKKGAAITLTLGLKNENPDAYVLTVDKKGVTIQGASESGVYRGVQTLRKAIGTEVEGNVTLPWVTIQDEPRFGYRGVHFDCSRHYFPVETVKQYIDMMALHGCNNLHWHITDDQGWRFEVKSMPELAKKGSVRPRTVIGQNTNIYDNQPVGGYYTQEECREIVRYAAERYINIIPEIDLPGHMIAALHVYPELGCTGGPYDVWTRWGVADDVLCAGNPKTLEFLKQVLKELADVFPSKMIHIGGDESPRVRWQHCPKCQAKMKELGLKKEAQLQTYINKELEQYMAGMGRELVGWDEVLEGGLSENAIVMSWRGTEGGIEAARQHHRVIMSPNSHCYIDHYQLQNHQQQPLAIGGYLPVSKVYSYEPIPTELTEEEAKYILGPQCNLWTEYVVYPEHAFYMLLPRLDALSEVQWLPKEQKDYEAFKARLPRMLKLYRKLGVPYCPKQE